MRPMNDLRPGGLPGATTSFAHDVAAWVLTAAALVFVLLAHLLPALFAGLLVHQLVHQLAPQLSLMRVRGAGAKRAAVGVLFLVTVGLVVLAATGLVLSIRSGAESLPELLSRMAEIIEARRNAWPDWLVKWLPADAGALETAVVTWLREHAGGLRIAGASAGRAVTYTLLGMIVGALVALRAAGPEHEAPPLARALSERVARLGLSFRRVVFAQVRISALNTLFTWLYLAVALPAFGIHLPLTKTLIAVTFACGLLPVLGNIISNTVMVVVSLSHSLELAAVSLAFLVAIHKLEYFLNARIVGTQIRAQAWELLIAMLAMEAAFGVKGVIAAPIYYAYLKNELAARGLV